MYRKCYMAHSDPHHYTTWYTKNKCVTTLVLPWNRKKTAKTPSCFVSKAPGSFETPNLDLHGGTLAKYMILARFVAISNFLFLNINGNFLFIPFMILHKILPKNMYVVLSYIRILNVNTNVQ